MLPVNLAMLFKMHFLKIGEVGIKQACSFIPTRGVRYNLSGELLIIYVKSLTFDPVIPLAYNYGKTNRQKPKYPTLAEECPGLSYVAG